MFAKLTTIRPKTVFFVKCCFFLLAAGCAAAQTKTGKNEFGLVIVANKKAYTASVKNAPGQRMVALSDYLKRMYMDIRYATADNFTKQVLYQNHTLFLRQDAAEKLAKVQDSLRKAGFGLLVYDGYRPYSVTKKMWAIVPDDRYAANPATGSGHNRGIAVDLTLTGLNGQPVLMPTGYDNFTDSAHHGFMQLPAGAIQHRELLKNVMEYFGFKALPTEWWHFSLPDAKKYPLLDMDFEALKKLEQQ